VPTKRPSTPSAQRSKPAPAALKPARPYTRAAPPIEAEGKPAVRALGDVARALNLSVSTVSRALRGHAKVAVGTRQLVEAEAARLGYRPNPFVVALMSSMRRDRRAPDTLSVLAWVDTNDDPQLWRHDPVQFQFFHGAKARAEALGHQLERFHGASPEISPARLTNILIARGISGILSSGHRFNTHGTAFPFNRDRFALVTVGSRRLEGDASFSTNDQFETARLATLRAHELGYRRIGFITSNELERSLDDRFVGGYLSALQRLRLLPSVPIYYYDDAKPDGQDPRPALKEWLSQNRPDAVIASVRPSTILRNQSQALPLPPGIGFAVLDWQRETPELAGVDQDHTRVGASAVDLLVAKLNRNELGPETAPSGILDEGVWHDAHSLPRRI
jgi:LacI family transcriptional regulator